MRSPQKIKHVSLYYRNLPVTPLRCTQGQAFVQSGTASLSLKTLPPLPHYCPTNPSTELFPGCNTSIGPRIALDTVSGNLVNPQRCRGHAPDICFLGAQYCPSRMQCATLSIHKDIEGMPPLSVSWEHSMAHHACSVPEDCSQRGRHSSITAKYAFLTLV